MKHNLTVRQVKIRSKSHSLELEGWVRRGAGGQTRGLKWSSRESGTGARLETETDKLQTDRQTGRQTVKDRQTVRQTGALS
jgi:hypothetical protein